jgi:hypothetical protein
MEEDNTCVIYSNIVDIGNFFKSTPPPNVRLPETQEKIDPSGLDDASFKMFQKCINVSLAFHDKRGFKSNGQASTKSLGSFLRGNCSKTKNVRNKRGQYNKSSEVSTMKGSESCTCSYYLLKKPSSWLHWVAENHADHCNEKYQENTTNTRENNLVTNLLKANEPAVNGIIALYAIICNICRWR